MKMFDLFDEYEKKFGKSITLPYFMRSDVTDEDFIKAVEKAIKTGEPIDMDYWFGVAEPGTVI